jgi:hypothetical protein
MPENGDMTLEERVTLGGSSHDVLAKVYTGSM